MTFNQMITLFSDISVAHKQLKSFDWGELWEVEGKIKPGIIYPMLYVNPVSSTMGEQTVNRTFTIMVFAQVMKDKSNEQDILSDTELILQDVVKILRNESDDYEVVADPQMFPFKEDLGDWVAGWRVDVEILTNGRSNYCDVPKETI